MRQGANAAATMARTRGVVDVASRSCTRRDARAGPQPHDAVVGEAGARKQPQQRALALAVAPDHADALALVDQQARRGRAAADNREPKA
jgi:hypothetical protein